MDRVPFSSLCGGDVELPCVLEGGNPSPLELLYIGQAKALMSQSGGGGRGERTI